MFSILLRYGTEGTWRYYSEGSEPWQGNLSDTKAKFIELLETYPYKDMSIVRNCVISGVVDITEVPDVTPKKNTKSDE